MRLLLILAILAQTLYVPFVAGPESDDGPLKGIGGPVDDARRAQVGAEWSQNWCLCSDTRYNPADPGDGCVSWIQKMGQYGSWERTRDWMRDELLTRGCPSGYIGFGDEWRLWRFPLDKQVRQLYWFSGIVQKYAPECEIIFGGFLTYHPSFGHANLAHLESFWQAYYWAYGTPPPVAGIGLDHYDWGLYGGSFVGDIQDYAAMIHRVYGPDTEIWLRETGSLLGHDAALDAIAVLPYVIQHVDRYAYFTSYYAGWDSISAFTPGWELTDIGRAYAALGTGKPPIEP